MKTTPGDNRHPKKRVNFRAGFSFNQIPCGIVDNLLLIIAISYKNPLMNTKFLQ